jgi:hypothetical protein
MGVEITKNRPSCVVLDYVANKAESLAKRQVL